MPNATVDDKNLAMLSHLLTFVGGFIAPLVIYLVKKDSMFVRENARHSLNFQISVFIYAIISLLLVFVIIGIVTLIALGIFQIVVIIIASVKASRGEIYSYPLEIPFIR